MSRKRLLIGLGALIVLAAAVAAVATLVINRPPEVAVATVLREDLSITVVATGRVEADERADVVPPTAGTLESIEVTEGERVKAGDVIAQMDTEQLEAQLRQAESAERAASAQLASARNAGPTQQQIASADDAVAQARQSYEEMRAAAATLNQRLSQIPEVGGVGGEDLDASALTDALVAQSYGQYQQALAQREALNVDTSGSVAALEAQVDQAAEQVRLARRLIEQATLKAPIDGVVLFNAVSAGGIGGGGASAALGGGSVDLSGAKPSAGTAVNPQQPPFTVVELASMRFSAEIDEADVGRIEPGMEATITLDAFADREFGTEVDRVLPQSQATATGGTVFPVLLSLHDTGADLLLGMRGDVTIRTDTVPAAVTMPVEALQEEGGNTFVYVVSSGRLEARDVRVGILTETRVEVERGLEPGDEVVVSGPDAMSDGMRVSVGG